MSRVLLMTGSGGRLGTAFYNKYQNDYTIVGCGREKKDHSAHYFIQADITNEAERVFDETLYKFGKIDVLVNNAAVYNMQPLEDSKLDVIEILYKTNVIIPHWLSVLALNKFWKFRVEKNKAKNRNIINISSISGMHVYKNQGLYAPSKAALNLLTQYQAEEFKQYGIRVNALAPTGFPRIITTESVADALREMDQSTETGLIKVMDKVD